MKGFYVTTPIYYVNGQPHLGSAYTTIAADVVARFKRMEGFVVDFLTGTDEHGLKVAQKANNEGITPQDFVDKMSLEFRKMNEVLCISEHIFERTTDQQHKNAVKKFWKILWNKGYIYQGKYTGWYAVRDEAFYKAEELVEGKAPTGAEVEWVEFPCYFFKLATCERLLLDFYAANPDFVGPATRFNEVKQFVKSGLTDLAISRSNFSWGIPVPDDDKQVIYVWIDALMIYLSGIGFPDFKVSWQNSLHLIGKDILRFHAVYWPAFLLAAGISPPKKIFAHGWWTLNGEKMSKSSGNTLNLFATVEKYGADQLRYFLLRSVPFGQDGDFNEDLLIGRINNDLADELGNLVQRTIVFIQKHYEGIVQKVNYTLDSSCELIKVKNDLLKDLGQSIDHLQLEKYLAYVWNLINLANKYISDQKPWELVKTNQPICQEVVCCLFEVLVKICYAIYPVMPNIGKKMATILNIEIKEGFYFSWDKIHKVNKEEILFKKIIKE